MRTPTLAALNLALLLVGGTIRAQSNLNVFGDRFAQGRLDCYLADAARLQAGHAVFEPAPDGKGNVLVLSNAAAFKFVPVNDGIKYAFAFKVRAETRETIEENPRLAEYLTSRDNATPDVDICFYDAEKHCVSSGGRMHYALPFGSWFNWSTIFYPPPAAAFVEISINAKGSKLFLRDFTLGPAADEGAINCYPTMDFGKYNCHIGGHQMERVDGKSVWDSGYGCRFGEKFPLAPGRHRLYAKGFTYGGYSTIGLTFLDKDGKTISGTELNSTPGGKQKEFEVPEGTVRGSILIYNNVLEELRLTRIADEALPKPAAEKQ